jgi:hypothetical protein
LPAIAISRPSSPASRLLQGMRGRCGNDQHAGRCLVDWGPRGNAATDTPRPAQPHIQSVGAGLPAIGLTSPPSPASRLLQGMRGRCGNNQRAGRCLVGWGPRSHGPRGHAATDTPRPAQPHIQSVGAGLPAIANSRPPSPASRLLQGMRGRCGNDQRAGRRLLSAGGCTNSCRGLALAVLWYTIIRTDTLTLHGARS